MEDLTARAGLAMAVNECRLEFNEPVTEPRLSIRSRSDLARVWRVPPEDTEDGEIYAVYWGTVPCADETAFGRLGLDHTYVVIRPGTCNGEYNKTQGHYHPPVVGSSLSQPELYHVMTGKGLFILQHAMPPDWQVDNVMLVDVEAGSIVVVPPNYGHLTVNYGDQPLVFEAFLAVGLQPVTASYQAKRGGACYCVATAEGLRVVPNERYGLLSPGHRQSVSPWRPKAAGPFYTAVTRHLEQFTWLREPDLFDIGRVSGELRDLDGVSDE